MSVLIVDWSGEGGVAETTRSWYNHARRLGMRCNVVTVLGRALRGTDVLGVEARTSPVGYMQHVALVELADGFIRKYTPKVVVVQGYAMPHEDQHVVTAAHESGSKVVQVVYAPRPAFWSKGSSLGLTRLLRNADALVAHSQHVYNALRPRVRQDAVLMPYAPFVDSLGALGAPSIDLVSAGRLDRDDEPGRNVVVDASQASAAAVKAIVEAVNRAGEHGAEPWKVTILEAARQRTPIAAQSAWMSQMREADVVLIPGTTPYGSLAASAALALGTVPIVADVGGAVEQIGGGRAGGVVPVKSRPEAWAEALAPFADPQSLRDRVAAGDAVVADQRADFRAAAEELLS